MVWLGPLLIEEFARVDVRPELADEDVRWLNAQMALVDNPRVVYARRALRPPPVVWAGH